MNRHRRFKRLSAAVARFLHGLADATLIMVFLALGGYALAYVLGLLAVLAGRFV